MNKKSVTVSYCINDNGCPEVAASEKAFATVHFTAAQQDIPCDQFVIEANRNGLLKLASWMIALADQDSVLDHQHFDNEQDFGFFQSKSACELIVQRVGK